MDTSDVIADLEQRLQRYPADRYPVQHATARFHLGGVLADAGRLPEARTSLEIASRLFEPDRLATEHAKTLNALGAVRRLAGDLDAAERDFRQAAALFAGAGLTLERGASVFNLGLVQRDRDDDAAATASFRQARDLLDARSAPGEAAAAARELGASLLRTGKLDEAADELRAAMELADRAADTAGLGAVANLLGLCHLGCDRAADAIEAFADAVAAHPRAVRPGEYAMAKANLALAYERAGEPDRAQLAAAQALGTPGAAMPVRDQAQDVLARIGDGNSPLLAVLDAEPSERWPSLVREDMARWVDADPGARRAEAGAWIDGQLARGAAAVDLAEVWLGGLLELPPDAMMTLIRATLEALAERDDDTYESFRSTVSRAVVRFHIPQWMRLKDCFNTVAGELGQEPSWG